MSRRPRHNLFFSILVKFTAFCLLAGVLLAGGIYISLAPNIPSTDVLQNVQFQVPLRIYSRDLKLMAEFGEKKRSPVSYEDVPELLIHAILAAEDDRFFQHPGVDYKGILRAAYFLIKTGEKVQGGSTITMQVARNFFLSREKTYLRKLNEILLALKIERSLSKEDILTLYINKIYLGNRAYGFAAAAQVYYGKTLEELTVGQSAMISGLPKAPSRFNPIVNLERALIRRNYILERMHSLEFLTTAQLAAAKNEIDDAQLRRLAVQVRAPHAAELVRSEMIQRYGSAAYTRGYRVITSIDSGLQQAANNALQRALLEYDSRHGYRGAEGFVSLTEEVDENDLVETLSEFATVNGTRPAIVTAVEQSSAVVYLRHTGLVQIDWLGMVWARPSRGKGQPLGPKPQTAGDILKAGDIIRVVSFEPEQWRLTQIPLVEGALVSLSPSDGAIKSLVGGFDFHRSNFNRVTQAERQSGSIIKPFIYSAALRNGFTAATLVNDAPVVFEDRSLESTWRPSNYSGKVFGPTRLRVGLVKSRNLVSIRLVRTMGVKFAIDHLVKFGFDRSKLPPDLSLALGSAAITPLDIATGYAVFANNGYQVHPYIIDRVVDANDEILYEANPAIVCEECKKVQDDPVQTEGPDPAWQPPLPPLASRSIDGRNIYLVNSMLRDVIKRGTGRRARVLRRSDIAGKTGTTNDQHDAWFSGFNQNIVTTAWVGFDQPRPLGDHETGGRAALPMWIYYMREALKQFPMEPIKQPDGLVTVRIDPESGLLANANYPGAIFETFRDEFAPRERVEDRLPGGTAATNSTANNDVPDQLF